MRVERALPSFEEIIRDFAVFGVPHFSLPFHFLLIFDLLICIVTRRVYILLFAPPDARSLLLQADPQAPPRVQVARLPRRRYFLLLFSFLTMSRFKYQLFILFPSFLQVWRDFCPGGVLDVVMVLFRVRASDRAVLFESPSALSRSRHHELSYRYRVDDLHRRTAHDPLRPLRLRCPLVRFVFLSFICSIPL